MQKKHYLKKNILPYREDRENVIVTDSQLSYSVQYNTVLTEAPSPLTLTPASVSLAHGIDITLGLYAFIRSDLNVTALCHIELSLDFMT